MHLEAMIDQDWSAWRRVDRRHAGCCDTIHQLVNLQLWDYDEVAVPWSLHGELAGGGRACREAHQKLKDRSRVNS